MAISHLCQKWFNARLPSVAGSEWVNHNIKTSMFQLNHHKINSKIRRNACKCSQYYKCGIIFAIWILKNMHRCMQWISYHQVGKNMINVSCIENKVSALCQYTEPWLKKSTKLSMHQESQNAAKMMFDIFIQFFCWLYCICCHHI